MVHTTTTVQPIMVSLQVVVCAYKSLVLKLKPDNFMIQRYRASVIRKFDSFPVDMPVVETFIKFWLLGADALENITNPGRISVCISVNK